jgi:formylglycine-generating enzyme required for sulfatase activity
MDLGKLAWGVLKTGFRIVLDHTVRRGVDKFIVGQRPKSTPNLPPAQAKGGAIVPQVVQADAQLTKMQQDYLKRKDAREVEILKLERTRLEIDIEIESAKAEREEKLIALKEQDLADRKAYSQAYLSVLRQQTQAKIDLVRERIQADFDLKNWSGVLSRDEALKIFEAEAKAGRLLMLVPPPAVVEDELLTSSFSKALQTEVRTELQRFFSRYYGEDSLCPVGFYGGYFSQAVFDAEVQQHAMSFSGIPTGLVSAEMTDYQVHFNLNLWGAMSSLSVPLDPFDWEEFRELLVQDEAISDRKSWRLVRQAVVSLYKLCGAFLADIYYLSVNPLHEPQLFALESELKPLWSEELAAQLREIQERCLAEYLEELRAQQEQVRQQEEEERRQRKEAEARRRRAAEERRRREEEERRRWRGETFDYDVVLLDRYGNIDQRNSASNRGYTERLEGIALEMANIPAGSFQMGSPSSESERQSDESPQHSVSVPEFFMGRTQVTQAQWRAVAQLPQVHRSIKSDPSYFTGDELPVENVTWYDCIEFCARLSRATGKNYRLPSEAEWEYACRAGTTTPFHFGETISPEVANYDGNYTYGQGKKGVYRQKTIPVGSFNAANAWGLYDMHGNLYEWCLDDWHGSYEGAPSDGRPWFKNDNHSQFEEDWQHWLYAILQHTNNKLLRGGYWLNYPGRCRSAYRYNGNPDYCSNCRGFRVALSRPRT